MSKRLVPITGKSQWGEREARHLLNRAGFGVPLGAVASLHAMGPERAVDSLVNYEQFEDNLREPEFLTSREEVARILAGGMSMSGSEEAQRERRQELQRRQRAEMDQLKVWWIEAMRNTTRPLQEKMALFWHGHFATSAEKVKLPLANYELNRIFRHNATGSFKSLVFLVGKSEAMLNYLDNRQNRKGHPNENWARELLELFTLGIGNYTEEDIKEAARAFTGYTERGGQFQFIANQHDNGEKTFLGKRGNLDGADVINAIFEHPKAANHISRKLWEYFVDENPDEELVDEMAEILRDAKFELKPLLERIFLSQEFYSERTLNNQVKSPAQYTVMLLSQLNLKMESGAMMNLAMRAMGQELFYPPNVKGWDGNRAWINTNTLLVRYNVAGYLLTGERPPIRQDPRLDEMAMEAERLPRNANGRNNDRMLAFMQERAGLDVKALWRPLHGETAGEAIETAAMHLLGQSLSPAQRDTLVKSLGEKVNAATRFDVEKTSIRDLSGTLHLILSMAEYQLC